MSKTHRFHVLPPLKITHQNPSVLCTPLFEESPHQNPSVLCTPPFEKSLFLVGAYFGVGVYFGKYGNSKLSYNLLTFHSRQIFDFKFNKKLNFFQKNFEIQKKFQL